MIITGSAGISRVLATTRTIAVVGLSPDPARASHGVARFMQARGYRIIPVNPGATEILGERCYPDLASIPDTVDMVDVFRRPDTVLPLAFDAIRIGARCLWLQPGVVNEAAIAAADAAGLDGMADHGLKIEYLKLPSAPA